MSNIYRSSKIFIYNTTEMDNENTNHDDDDDNDKQNNTSSITILTSGIPEYHIRIKNSFKSEALKASNKDEPTEVTTIKDDAKHCLSESFTMNEDVLMRTGDDKFYLGTVVSISNGRYLIKFDDNTEKWAPEQKLKKLNSSLNTTNHDDPLCVVCKEKNESDVVEVCHKCSRGYHLHCSKQNSSNFSSPWCCDRCTASEIISISDSEENDLEEALVELQHPYKIKSLKWDSHHRENKEQKYCYCGKTGLWKKKMLQCCKCQQWFHEKCIKLWNAESNKSILLHGDMFFVFCCKICNEGVEFITRLNLNWKTAIHLVLYELSITSPQKKYFSITNDIVPFLWERWNQLHFPFENCNSKEKLRKKILQIVRKGDEFRLLAGGNKIKGDSVNLRRKNPPVVFPKVSLPSGYAVSEKSLKKLNIKTCSLYETSKIHVDVHSEKANAKEDFSNATKNKEKKRSTKTYSQMTSSYQSILADAPNDDSSDENSSKSTLDWIIPPPTNFHGKNNPFHSQYKYNNTNGSLKKGQKKFEKFPEIRIVRTIKRRLSAKDITFSMTQDSKRRKLLKRRKSSDVEVISEIIQPVTMPFTSFLPVRNFESKEFMKNSNPQTKDCEPRSESIQSPIRSQNSCREKCNSDDIGTNDSYQSDNQKSISFTDSVINSPMKNKSINLYFGALNRIENGENFTILAKRLTFDKKEQYLLEWDSTSTSGKNAKFEN